MSQVIGSSLHPLTLRKRIPVQKVGSSDRFFRWILVCEVRSFYFTPRFAPPYIGVKSFNSAQSIVPIKYFNSICSPVIMARYNI